MATAVAASLPVSPSPRRPGVSLRDLVSSTLSVDADVSIAEVSRLFEAQPDADSIAVLDGARVGIVVRARFYLQLGRRFGYALFENREVRLLAEEGSTVEADADPVEVITLATQRDPQRIYDDLLVVEQGRYVGTVAVRSLLAHHKDLLAASIAELALLDERNRRLEELQRLQSEFVANMTHELRAPLHALLGSVRLLADEPALHEALRPAVLGLGRRAQAVLAIVDNVLDLARLEAGAMEPLLEDVDVAALCEEALTAIQPLVDHKHVRLERRLRGLTQSCRVDPVFLRRILGNLLSNAAKFTESGRVLLDVELERGWLTLRVHDTGIGIRAADLERLFQRFTQLEAARTKRHSGSGLGLAIVKGLAERLGGAVSVSSREGEGSTFSVRVPVAPRQEESR